MWAKRSSPKALLWFLDAFVCVLPQPYSGTKCDRTISEMRGLSPKIISEDSRRSENAQTHMRKHTVPNMKFKLKLLQIKCHVLGFTKDKAQNGASEDNQSLCGSVRLSRRAHTLHPRRVSAYSDDLCLWVPVGNPALISLDLPLTALIGIVGRRRKILTCTRINKNNKSKSLSDYAQQDLSVMTRRSRILDMQDFKWNNGLKPTSTYY
jgi:hypothetical protein